MVLVSSGIAAFTIGLVLANLIQLAKDLFLGTIENTVEIKELPGVYQTILICFPVILWQL